MTTKLDHPLKRELQIQDRAYTVTISPHALQLVPKGRRKGFELRWVDLVSGDAALATALNASLRLAALAPERRSKPSGKRPRSPRPKRPSASSRRRAAAK